MYEDAKNSKQYKLLIDAGFQDVTPKATKSRGSFTFETSVMASRFYVTPKSGYIRKHTFTTGREYMPQRIRSGGVFRNLNDYESAFKFLRQYFSNRADGLLKNIFKQQSNIWQPNKYLTGGAK